MRRAALARPAEGGWAYTAGGTSTAASATPARAGDPGGWAGERSSPLHSAEFPLSRTSCLVRPAIFIAAICLTTSADALGRK